MMERQYNPIDVNLDREQSVKTSVGRPKGSTSAESLRRKQEMLDDREERLRAEGVRRSERLANIQHAKIADNINIPPNVDEAYNDKNWREAMEEELDSLKRHEVGCDRASRKCENRQE